MLALADKIKELSPELQQEVEDFVDFLRAKQSTRTRSEPTFNWAGVLRDEREQHTSVELQHEISSWRVPSE